MSSDEIRRKFLEFFKERGHVVVPSSSLIPDDPSVLLTTAGMQQFKKYFTGELNAKKDFVLLDGTPALGTASCQKSFRTSDIDEVGDESHLTFFEMLGNFSFGGYGQGREMKERAITLAWEFIIDVMQISKDRIYVTVLDTPGLGLDEESFDIWSKFLPKEKIKTGNIDDNFWGPTGADGPCGPTTEIYVDGVEIWNIVFNQYFSKTSREEAYKNGWQLEDLKTMGVDTGMGLERLAMVKQGTKTIFETDLFDFINNIRKKQPDKYTETDWRIIADHIRGAVFLIADGVMPSNKDRGSILRNLIRRALIKIEEFERIGTRSMGTPYPSYGDLRFETIANGVVEEYKKFYPDLRGKEKYFIEIMAQERSKLEDIVGKLAKLKDFSALLSASMSYFVQKKKEAEIEEKIANLLFDLHQSEGARFELLKEIIEGRLKIKIAEDSWSNIERIFNSKFQKHKEISRAGAVAKFGGHGLYLKTGEVTIRDKSEAEKVTRLHTATHLLHQALRTVLGSEVKQSGSDITVERTRFDFNFPRKLTPEEVKSVEELVNEKIKEDLPVAFVEMPKEEAQKTGALYFFKERYPDRVKVYYMGPAVETAWSKEFCGGPHVTHTAEVGTFKIIKEEAVGSGMRRIRGVVDP